MIIIDTIGFIFACGVLGLTTLSLIAAGKKVVSRAVKIFPRFM